MTRETMMILAMLPFILIGYAIGFCCEGICVGFYAAQRSVLEFGQGLTRDHNPVEVGSLWELNGLKYIVSRVDSDGIVKYSLADANHDSDYRLLSVDTFVKLYKRIGTLAESR